MSDSRWSGYGFSSADELEEWQYNGLVVLLLYIESEIQYRIIDDWTEKDQRRAMDVYRSVRDEYYRRWSALYDYQEWFINSYYDHGGDIQLVNYVNAMFISQPLDNEEHVTTLMNQWFDRFVEAVARVEMFRAADCLRNICDLYVENCISLFGDEVAGDLDD